MGLTPPRRRRVLVVEDDPLLREDFERTVRSIPGLDLAGGTGLAREAQRLLTMGPAPDVMLLDLGLPDGDGVTLIRVLLDAAPQARVLVISVFGDEQHVVRALAAGAHGYLLKDATAGQVAQAIRDVIAGDAPLSPRIARYLLRQFEPRPGPPLPAGQRLSAREAQILTLVAHGHSAPEVAARLQLSLHTVNTHLRNSYAKLAASNRVQAVNRARQGGQID